jgi:hypothetical protein
MSLTLTLTAADGATSSVTLPDPPVQTLSVPVNVGETAILAAVDNGNGNLLLAQPITLGQAGTLQSLSFYVSTIGGELRLGLYSNASGKPGTKLAETNAFTPILGWNTQPPLTTPTLQPGPYWIAYLPQSNALGFKKTNAAGPACWYGSFIFGTMPTTFPTTTTNITTWSFYATFLEAPPTMPAPPAGLSAAAVSSSQINLSWTASAGATGYKVFRNGSQVGTSALTTYADIGLAPSTSYTYTIEATNSSGASAMSPASIEATFAVSLGGGGMVYPFPNALNTGVPGYPNATTGPNTAAKAALPAWPGGSLSDGQVISGYYFDNPYININANNVTIKNCYIEGGNGSSGQAFAVSNAWNGTGTVSGSTFTVLTTNFGTIRTGLILELGGSWTGWGTSGSGLPPPEPAYATITSGSGSTWTLNNGTVNYAAGTPVTDCWNGGTIIQDNEFFNTNDPRQGGGGGTMDAIASYTGGLTLLRNNMHGYCKDVNGTGSGLTAKGNYCWNMYATPSGEHSENFYITAMGDVLIEGNTCTAMDTNTTSLFFTDNFGSVYNATIENNLVIQGNNTQHSVAFNQRQDGTQLSGPPTSEYEYYALNNALGTANPGSYNAASGGGYTNPTAWTGNYDWVYGQQLDPVGINDFVNNTAPVIAQFLSSNQTVEPAFTPDSTTFMQYVTTSLTFTLQGCTAPGDTIAVYQDGSGSALGTTTANASTGIWTYTVTATAGVHYYVAKDTTLSLNSPQFYVDVQS